MENKTEIDAIRANYRNGETLMVCQDCAFYLSADLGDY